MVERRKNMAENKKDTKLSETEKREMLLKFAKKFDSVVADSICHLND